MIKDKYGGPEFPQGQGKALGDVSTLRLEGGLSMRDYFAAKAMKAIVGNDEFLFRLAKLKNYDAVVRSEIALEAYSIADAMLKEREK